MDDVELRLLIARSEDVCREWSWEAVTIALYN